MSDAKKTDQLKLPRDTWGSSAIGRRGNQVLISILAASTVLGLLTLLTHGKILPGRFEAGLVVNDTPPDWNTAIKSNWLNSFSFISAHIIHLFAPLGREVAAGLIISIGSLVVLLPIIKAISCSRSIMMRQDGIESRGLLGKQFIPWGSVQQVTIGERKFPTRGKCVEFVGQNKNGKLVRTSVPLDVARSSAAELRWYFENYLPPKACSPELLPELISSEVHSYTDIWWRSLRLTVGQGVGNLKVGDQVADYVVTKVVSSSDQASVYLARSESGYGSNKKVADYNCELGPDGTGAEPYLIKEYLVPEELRSIPQLYEQSPCMRERAILSMIQHDVFPKIRNVIEESGRILIVFDRERGETLSELIERRGALSESEVIRIGVALCDALSVLASHGAGIVHRDVTPPNILIEDTPPHSIHLLDFNSAFELDKPVDKSFVGRPAYSPPEQIRGQSNLQSDQYAVARTLYFCITGREAEALTPLEEQPWPLAVNDELKNTLIKASAYEDINRFANAADFKEALLTCERITLNLKKRENVD